MTGASYSPQEYGYGLTVLPSFCTGGYQKYSSVFHALKNNSLKQGNNLAVCQKKWDPIYGTLGMRYGRKVLNGCEKRRVGVITYQIDGNYTIFGQFWTDSSLESPGSFFIMRHTFLWDNQDRSRDHPHRMGSGNPWPRPNIQTLYPKLVIQLCTGRIRT